MYAVISTGGKQYRVKAGDLLHVEKLDGVKGNVTFDQVLLVADGDKVKVGAPTVAGAKVLADVVTYADHVEYKPGVWNLVEPTSIRMYE